MPPSIAGTSLERDAAFPFLQTARRRAGPSDPRANASRWMYLPIGAVAIGLPVGLVATFTDRGEVALAALVAVAAGLVAWRFVARYVRRVTLEALRDEIAARTDRLVDPRAKDAFRVRVIDDDPAAGAGGVEDGFCLVDEPGRRLLYEGERGRWEIPVAAIRTCAVRQTLSRRVEKDRNRGFDYYVVCVELERGPARRTLPLQVLEWNASDPPFPLTSQKGAGWLTDRVRSITHPVGPIEE